MLTSLASNDLAIGFLVTPFGFLPAVYGCWPYGEVVCQIQVTIQYIYTFQRISNMYSNTLIGVDLISRLFCSRFWRDFTSITYEKRRKYCPGFSECLQWNKSSSDFALNFTVSRKPRSRAVERDKFYARVRQSLTEIKIITFFIIYAWKCCVCLNGGIAYGTLKISWVLRIYYKETIKWIILKSLSTLYLSFKVAQKFLY